MLNLEPQKINQLIYSEYNPKVEYPDDVLLEFDFYDATDIILKYGIGTSHIKSFKSLEKIIYTEGNIIITRSIHNDIYIYKYITGQKIDSLKIFWLNNNIKNQNCNLLIDIDINKSSGVIAFYLQLCSWDGFNNWGYLNYLAGNLNNLYEMIENENIKILQSKEGKQDE